MSPHRPAYLLWLLLAAPSLWLITEAFRAGADLDLLTATSGLWAAWLLVAALALTPLLRLLPSLGWLRPQRRAIGLAAFATSTVHLGLYGAAMADFDAIFAEITTAGIWTGWAALALLLPLALTSRDTAMRRLGRGWKRLQRLAYPAALLTLLHMGLVHNGWQGALWLAVPLLVLQLTRLLPRRALPAQPKVPA